MKLLYCNTCGDTFGLSYTTKTCQCGECGGHYERDGLNATAYGNATPLGFANSSFKDARETQPEWGAGREFTAFVIPKVCPTFKLVPYEEYIPSDGNDYGDAFDELMDKATLDAKWSKIENVFRGGDSEY